VRSVNADGRISRGATDPNAWPSRPVPVSVDKALASRPLCRSLALTYVVGADGLRSRVAGLVGAAINELGPGGGAAQYAYARQGGTPT
jgi:hypothetical protein